MSAREKDLLTGLAEKLIYDHCYLWYYLDCLRTINSYISTTLSGTTTYTVKMLNQVQGKNLSTCKINWKHVALTP